MSPVKPMMMYFIAAQYASECSDRGIARLAIPRQAQRLIA